eukprot:scaffold268421_cov31-Tisochrysis_lutea.AAC.4
MAKDWVWVASESASRGATDAHHIVLSAVRCLQAHTCALCAAVTLEPPEPSSSESSFSMDESWLPRPPPTPSPAAPCDPADASCPERDTRMGRPEGTGGWVEPWCAEQAEGWYMDMAGPHC